MIFEIMYFIGMGLGIRYVQDPVGSVVAVVSTVIAVLFMAWLVMSIWMLHNLKTGQNAHNG